MRPVINKAKFFGGSRRTDRCPFNSTIADLPIRCTFSAMAASFVCSAWSVGSPVLSCNNCPWICRYCFWRQIAMITPTTPKLLDWARSPSLTSPHLVKAPSPSQCGLASHREAHQPCGSRSCAPALSWVRWSAIRQRKDALRRGFVRPRWRQHGQLPRQPSILRFPRARRRILF